MEAIEKMASLCMRDEDEQEGTDEEDVEADDDLLVSILSGAGGLSPHCCPVHWALTQAPGLVSLQAELNEVLGEEQKTLESHTPVAQVYLQQPFSLQPRFNTLAYAIQPCNLRQVTGHF